MQERPVPKKNSDPWNQRPEPRERDKLYQLGMKAEMGSIRKAMMNAGISLDKEPNEQKIRDASDKGK